MTKQNNPKAYHHTPVLLQQAITFLNPKPGQVFIDGTLGGGGYTHKLLDLTKPTGKVLAIDLDRDAIQNAQSNFHTEISAQRLLLIHNNFARLGDIYEQSKEFFGGLTIDGIVVDIGLSSYQLDQSGRGITFQKKETLDMRFDISSEEPDAKFILNHWEQEELVKIFKEYGEEKNSVRLAKAIIQARANQSIHYTTELVEIIQNCLPKPIKHKWPDTARRIFQALRIAVNHELENLSSFLEQALDLVKPNGVIVIVTFHSLEDRIVKQFFVQSASGCICPKDFPICKCGIIPRAEILTKRPIRADAHELIDNSRSASAKLRAIRKLI